MYGGCDNYKELSKLAGLADTMVTGPTVSGASSSRRAISLLRADAAAMDMEAVYAYDYNSNDMANSGAAAMASGVDVGEVFQYQLDSPVTIERQRSAMIPIISTPIQGRRVSIFNRYDGSNHPMRGL